MTFVNDQTRGTSFESFVKRDSHSPKLARSRVLMRWYLAALLCIPFYIGPELAANAQLNAERLLVAALAYGMLFGFLKTGIGSAFHHALAKRPFTVTMLSAYFLWRLLSAIDSPYQVSKLLFVNEFLVTGLVPLVFYALYFRTDKTLQVWKIISGSIIFIFAIAFLERFTGQNPFTQFAPSNAGSAILNSAIERAGGLRSKATFEHPLTLSNFVILTLPIVLFAGRKLEPRRWRRVTSAILLISLAIFTGSRTALLLTAAILAIYGLSGGLVFSSQGRKINFGFLLLPLLPVVVFGVIWLAEQKSGHGVFSSYARQAQITNGLISISAQPWFGFGAGPGPITAIFEAVRFGDGSMKLWEANSSTVDNWYLSVLLGSGYPAIFFLIGFQLCLVGMSLRILSVRAYRFKLSQVGNLGLFVGLTISCAAGMAVMSILSIFTLHSFYFILVLWLLSLQIQATEPVRGNRAEPS